MAVRLPQLVLAKKVLKRALSASRSSSGIDIRKGHFAVYVGEGRRRFVIPTSYLKSPTFQRLLKEAEEEYGFQSQMGLTIPCSEDAFRALTLQLA
ncbi:protein SMALL AUXIN UP-REGULATED RNA 51-like [Nymphaea colorata]|uniref:protein SMALL AUXIN UP-REGULATED RNA 51-like n=1 Tax=Nymphaea colorata TaxID=210225 RepID=UPI00129EF896|nr:protein SMALL AUXIN UP-REGULATED RNA 51-like [Nymphaea colorata]